MYKNLCKRFFKNYSISREYSLFSAIIIGLILIICVNVTWQHYRLSILNAKTNLELSAKHLDADLTDMFDKTKQMMIYLSKQIAKENYINLVAIDRILSNVITLEHVMFPILTWHGFDWINNQDMQVVNGNGILKEPIDISQRSFLLKCKIKPGELYFANPDIGIPSKMWVIPIGLGVVNSNERYIGTISAGINIAELTKKLAEGIKEHKVKFVILNDQDKLALSSFEIAKLEETHIINKIKPLMLMDYGFVEQAKDTNWQYFYYLKMKRYPYTILIIPESSAFDQELYLLLWSRIAETLLVGIVVLALLFFYQQKIIKPIKKLSEFALSISQGNFDVSLPSINSKEVFYLARTLLKVKKHVKDLDNYRLKLEDSNQQLQLTNIELAATKQQLEDIAEIARVSDFAKEKFISKITDEARMLLEMVAKYSNTLLQSLENKSDILITQETQYWLIKQIYDASTNMHFNMNSLDLKALDLLEIFNECVIIHSRDAAINGIKLSLSIHLDMQPFYADELRFKQIILGLLARSIKYTAANSNIAIIVTVITKDKKPYLQVTISDDGFGFTGHEIAKFSDKLNLHSKQNGMKIELKLQTINKLIELHNGYYTIETKLGKGTNITVYFPMRLSEESDEAKATAKIIELANLRP